MKTDGSGPARPQVARAAAILVTGAGWIHLLAAEDHWAHPHVAAFFVATAVLQLSWAASVMYDATSRLLLTGLVGNLGLVLLWIVSRTTGVVFVPDASHVEPIGIPDAAASVLELVAATALAALLTTRNGAIGATAARRWVASAAALTLPLVVVAGVTGTAHHHDPVTGGEHATR